MKFVDIIFSTVISIYDGDTIKVDIQNCAIDVLCKGIEVRLMGYDSPEIRGKCQKEKDLAQQAKKLVQEAYPIGSTVVLSNNNRDKYFRLLSNQPVIAKKLLNENLAVPYFGGKKDPMQWCR